VLPLELKTGKPTFSAEHTGQVHLLTFFRQSALHSMRRTFVDKAYVAVVPGPAYLPQILRFKMQCFRSGFIESGSGSSISGWIPIRIRIQGFDEKKIRKKIMVQL